MVTDYKILPIYQKDRTPVRNFLKNKNGSCIVIKNERVHQADELPGFIAVQTDAIIGLVTIYFHSKQCEIVTLDCNNDNGEIKNALVQDVINLARENHCKRVWVIVTNDNTPCLAFFQKMGFTISQFFKDAADFTRHVNPDYPLYGIDNIPVRDEIELEFLL